MNGRPPGARTAAVYIDKLDGKIRGAFRGRVGVRTAPAHCGRVRESARLRPCRTAPPPCDGRCRAAGDAVPRATGPPSCRAKRRLLNFVISNCCWEDGKVVATVRQPSDISANATDTVARSGAAAAVFRREPRFGCVARIRIEPSASHRNRRSGCPFTTSKTSAWRPGGRSLHEPPLATSGTNQHVERNRKRQAPHLQPPKMCAGRRCQTRWAAPRSATQRFNHSASGVYQIGEV